MSRRKIDYGIDLGTTNSAISRVESGEAEIIKSMPMQKDTTPSCVAVTKRKGLITGDKALNQLDYERKADFISEGQSQPNSFIEFKRTMGNDKKYPSSILNKDFSSEELSAEVLKALKNYVTDEDVLSAVITVPAMFTTNQKDATRRAAKLAGIRQCELLQEPIAASMAYGIKNKVKDGLWIVFDFGGGTFDAALMKVEEGITKVVDTDGDNHLGGKNLDYEIIDQILIPYFKENYTISNILSDSKRKRQFSNMWKQKAEEAKIQLSMQESLELLTDLGEDWGKDDYGVAFELDLVINREGFNRALRPVFQRAIDITKEILIRNNITGADLSSLILVGGPTYSPLLREMLREQICDVDTSIDPMTAVANGAALYASTIDVESEIVEESKDISKVQLDLSYEASTVELNEFLTVKLSPNQSSAISSEKLLIEATRSDGAWSSGKLELSEIGDVIELNLTEGKPNLFTLSVHDAQGNKIPNEPDQITIIQGSKAGSATLPYHFGIAIADRIDEKIVFEPIQGLERNKTLPATGTLNNYKTQKEIRPGISGDFLKIPLYQAEHDAEGSRAVYNEHVYDIIISGNDLPRLLPANSVVDLTFFIDRSEKIRVEAYFQYLDHTADIEVPDNRVQEEVETKWLEQEIERAEDESVEPEIKKEIKELKTTFENNKEESDRKKEVLDRIRQVFRKIDQNEAMGAWPKLQTELQEELNNLENAQKEMGDHETQQIVDELKKQYNQVLKSEDIRLGKELLKNIRAIHFDITRIYQYIGLIRGMNDDYRSLHWTDSRKARELLDIAVRMINEGPTVDSLHPIVIQLFDLLPQGERRKMDESILTK